MSINYDGTFIHAHTHNIYIHAYLWKEKSGDYGYLAGVQFGVGR